MNIRGSGNSSATGILDAVDLSISGSGEARFEGLTAKSATVQICGSGDARVSGMTAPMVLDGAMNEVAFQAHVQQVLVPTMAPGDIVIMDNLPAHKAEGLRQARCRMPIALSPAL